MYYLFGGNVLLFLNLSFGLARLLDWTEIKKKKLNVLNFELCEIKVHLEKA